MFKFWQAHQQCKGNAAGLQISDRIAAQINGLEQGNHNPQDGIAFCQTMEGTFDEMTDRYQRIRLWPQSRPMEQIQRMNEDYSAGGEASVRCN